MEDGPRDLDFFADGAFSILNNNHCAVIQI